MKATIKVKVIDDPTPPSPPFVGTALTVDLPDGLTAFGIQAITPAAGATCLSVDKGDGSAPITVTGADFPLVLDYAAPGRYVIRLSDDIAVLQVNSSAADEDFAKYKPFLAAVTSNAVRLREIGASCFFSCGNLASVDLTRCAASHLAERAFKACAGLPARIDLPNVATFGGTGLNLPFRLCNSVREIHFAAAHEATIRANPAFERYPNLGAANATVSFDFQCENCRDANPACMRFDPTASRGGVVLV